MDSFKIYSPPYKIIFYETIITVILSLKNPFLTVSYIPVQDSERIHHPGDGHEFLG
jgi:hypothetical protein